MKKIVQCIEYCNSHCPNFFFRYDDNENIWCTALRAKIHDASDDDKFLYDTRHRAIPRECPLPNCTMEEANDANA